MESVWVKWEVVFWGIGEIEDELSLGDQISLETWREWGEGDQKRTRFSLSSTT